MLFGCGGVKKKKACYDMAFLKANNLVVIYSPLLQHVSNVNSCFIT